MMVRNKANKIAEKTYAIMYVHELFYHPLLSSRSYEPHQAYDYPSCQVVSFQYFISTINRPEVNIDS
jgi:hypothetical protein